MKTSIPPEPPLTKPQRLFHLVAYGVLSNLMVLGLVKFSYDLVNALTGRHSTAYLGASWWLAAKIGMACVTSGVIAQGIKAWLKKKNKSTQNEHYSP